MRVHVKKMENEKEVIEKEELIEDLRSGLRPVKEAAEEDCWD